MLKRLPHIIVLVLVAFMIISGLSYAAMDWDRDRHAAQEIEASEGSYVFGTYFVGVVELSEAGATALESQVGDLQEWIEGIVEKRTRDAIDECVVRILQDKDDFYLTAEDKSEYMDQLESRGIWIATLDEIPDELKAELILKAAPRLQ